MNEIPTPRTDEWMMSTNDILNTCISHARQLERELIETEKHRFAADAERRNLRNELEKAEEKIENLEWAEVHTCGPECGKPLCVMRRERNAARAECVALREALECISINACPIADPINVVGGDLKASWEKLEAIRKRANEAISNSARHEPIVDQSALREALDTTLFEKEQAINREAEMLDHCHQRSKEADKYLCRAMEAEADNATLKARIADLVAALDGIHTKANYLSRAGVAATPDIASAFGKFRRIADDAFNAIWLPRKAAELDKLD